MGLKAVITIGAPASGKTTFGEDYIKKDNGNWVILERDIIRQKLCQKYKLFPYNTWIDNFQELYYNLDKTLMSKIEKEVSHEIDRNINAFKDNLMLSNTNLSKKRLNHLYANLQGRGYEVEIKVLNPSLSKLLDQNGWRNDAVNDNVVFDLYQRLQHLMGYVKALPNYEFISDHETDTCSHYCVIVDLDGTVAHITKDINGEPTRTYYDMTKVDEDQFDDVVFSMVNGLLKAFDGTQLVFLTGRNSDCFTKTVSWLDKNLSFWDLTHENGGYQLFTRLRHDYRKDCIVKEELYNTFIKDKYEPIAVFDDRVQMVNLWNDLGLKTIAVADQRKVF